MTNEELREQMVAAMKAKEKTRLSIIRQVMAEVKNIEVNERRDATEEDVNGMIKRLIKQTTETLEMSRQAGNNQERTDTLAEQVEILESLLPEQVSGDALAALIDQVIAEVGATSRKDMGRVMGALTAATGGTFDKPAAAKEVGARLAEGRRAELISGFPNGAARAGSPMRPRSLYRPATRALSRPLADPRARSHPAISLWGR